MRNRLSMNDSFNFSIDRKVPTIADGLGFGGRFWGELLRPKKSGGLRKVGEFQWNNLILDAAKLYMFDATFNGASQTTNWYLGLINAVGYTSILSSYTASAHAGWTEFTSYTESVRQTWNKGAAASNAITGASVSTFTISADGSLAGGFLASVSTKGATTGLHWSAGAFTTAVPVLNGDAFRLNYAASA